MRTLFRRAAVLLTCLLLTGCGTELTSSNEDIIYIPDDAFDHLDETIEPISIDWADAEQKALLEQRFTMDADNTDFLAALEGHAEYPELSFVPFDEANARYAEIPELDQEPKYGVVTNLPLDPDALYERVLANNARKEAKEGISAHISLSEEDLRWSCEIICETLNRELTENEFPDRLDDIDANIANLTMFGNPGMDNAAVLDDGTVTLSRQMAENMIVVSGNPVADRMTMTHETEHLMQKTAVEYMDDLGLERSYAFMAVWNDMDVDPLFYNWYIEAAAESLTARFYDCEPSTYRYKIGYLNSLSLITILDGYDSYDLARLTQQESMDAWYDIFRCETEEEKRELQQVFYAIEVIQQEPEEYMTAYTAETGRDITDAELTRLKVALKSSLLQTLNRYFYRNLSHAVTERDMTAAEVCHIIALWEMDVHKHLTYTDSGFIVSSEPMLEAYKPLQESFFASAAEKMGVDAAFLAETYAACYENIPVPFIITTLSEEDKADVIEIRSFNAEENAFLNYFYWDSVASKAVPMVNAVS